MLGSGWKETGQNEYDKCGRGKAVKSCSEHWYIYENFAHVDHRLFCVLT